MRHPLVKLAALSDWSEIERRFAASFSSGFGRSVLVPRLIAGLLYLQHTYRRVRRGGGQHLAGEPVLVVLQRRGLPSDRAAHRYVQSHALEKAHRGSRRGGVIQKANVQQVIVDTTVISKAIAQLTDSYFLDGNRQHLVTVAVDN